MKVLITGGGGFIGHALVSHFLEDGHSVVATYRNNKPDLNPHKVVLVRTDLGDDLTQLPAVDLIVHAAAHTHLILNSCADNYIQSNIIGMQNIVAYARRVKPRHFIYLSTLSVYGEITTPQLTEDTALNKTEMYGITKLMGEMILKENESSFPSTCVRLPGVVGPGYFTPWLGTIVKKAVMNEPINIYNPDTPFNNIVDIIEFYRFISWIANRECQGSNSFNLAASEPMALKDVVGLILELTNSKSQVHVRETNKQSFVISINKLYDIYKFRPATTQDMVRRYVVENLLQLRQMASAGS